MQIEKILETPEGGRTYLNSHIATKHLFYPEGDGEPTTLCGEGVNGTKLEAVMVGFQQHSSFEEMVADLGWKETTTPYLCRGCLRQWKEDQTS